MPQQVWAFLNANGESWAAADLARRLDMPESTVRGQLRGLLVRGKVTVRPYAGRMLYKRVDR
jgi:DNA-binding IclR family transcriptional regulator